MRPTTANKNKLSRPATGASKEAHSAYENADMMISGKELGSQFGVSGSASNKNLPRYKSVRMNIPGAEDGKDESNIAGRGARAGQQHDHQGTKWSNADTLNMILNKEFKPKPKDSSSRGSNAGAETPKSSTSLKHASQKYPQFGVHGTNTSSKKDSAGAPSTSHQPRQKRQSVSKQAPNSKSNHASGATGNYAGGFGVRNARSRDTGNSSGDISKKQEEYGVSGTSMSKFGKSSMRNNDICDELTLSKEGMRFDQRQKDAEEAESKRLLDKAK